MHRIISDEWLKEQRACPEARRWVADQSDRTFGALVQSAIDSGEIVKLRWANWGVVRCLELEDRVRCAIFAAEQVIGVYESKHPEDMRPRNAIAVAKNYLTDHSAANAANAANAAANAAADAANAANAAANAAADAAANAANAANAAAYAAANAADAAADAAANAANAAANAADAAMRIKILEYGLSLLRESKTC